MVVIWQNIFYIVALVEIESFYLINSWLVHRIQLLCPFCDVIVILEIAKKEEKEPKIELAALFKDAESHKHDPPCWSKPIEQKKLYSQAKTTTQLL